MKRAEPGSLVTIIVVIVSASSSIVLRSYNPKIEMRLFILYNLQLEIINFLYKNLRKQSVMCNQSTFHQVKMTMTEYQAKSNNSLSFDVTKDDKLIGKLSYKSWFKFNAVIEITNKSNYQVEPKGFWGTTIELKDGEKVLLKFKMNWNGEIVVQTYFNDFEKGYIFKHRGVFKESFILIDQEGIELLVMKPHLRWNKMNYEYQITTSDTFETFSNKEVLLMTSLHCANYYMSIMTTIVAGA